MSQSSYGAVEGGEAVDAAHLQTADTVVVTNDVLRDATPEAPDQELASGHPQQGVEDSARPDPSRGLVNLPDGLLQQAIGNSAEFLNLVRALQQSMMSGSGNHTNAEAPPEDAGGNGTFLSFESTEATPTARGTSDLAAQAQGTPDFPHRIQEEMLGGSLSDLGSRLEGEGLGSRGRDSSGGPLFAPEQMAQWARLEQGAPLLYGPNQGQESFRTLPRSETPSVLSSGEIQAEVRRQLDAIRMSHAVQMEALARENEQLRRQVASSGGSVEQEPRRWGSAANRVMDWFRGGGSSSAVVPTGTQTLLNSLQNLIPKASASVPSRRHEQGQVSQQAQVLMAQQAQASQQARVSSAPQGQVRQPAQVQAQVFSLPQGQVPPPPPGQVPSEVQDQVQMPLSSQGEASSHEHTVFVSGLPPVGTGPTDYPLPQHIPKVSSVEAALPPPGLSVAPSPVSQDPLDVVLAGMAQLQTLVGDLSRQGGISTNNPETVKPGVSALPALPEPGSEDSTLAFSDWLHVEQPALSDVSDTSDRLWSLATREAADWYKQYQAQTPVMRLSSKVVPSSTLLQPKWSRVRHRIEAMIVSASPSSIKEELSSSRTQGLLQVLCKLYVVYRPGGLAERELAISRVSSPHQAKTVAESVSELRMWKRWTVRLTDLGGSMPDPAVLLKALTTITAGPLATLPDVAFRVQLVKATLQVDVTPTSASVQQLYECLLTELEGEVRFGKASARARSVKDEGKPDKGVPTPPKSPPKIPPPPKASQVDGKTERCRAFHGGSGCKRGAQCPYLHEWTSIPKIERSKLCMLCGASGHRKDQCSAPAMPKSPKKGDGVKTDGKAMPSPTASSTAGPSAKAGQGFTAKQLEGLLQGAQAALSSLQTSPPPKEGAAVKAVCCAAGLEDKGALLDSGATHSVVSTSEARKLKGPMESCEVSLAGDVRCTWSKTPGGTLVVPEQRRGSASDTRPQTLVPLGAVVTRLGCKLTWSRTKGLRLQHPKRGLLPTKIVNGCPQLPNDVALELVQELELCNGGPREERTKELYQAVLMDHLTEDPERALKEYVSTGAKVQALQAMLASEPFREFTALCQCLAVDAPVSDDLGWEALKSLPLPRRARKRLFRSPWIVNFGAQCSPFFTQVMRSKGFEILEAGKCEEDAWVSLLWGAFSARVSAVLSGGEAEETDHVSTTIRPLWLWTLSSVSQGTCIPMMSQWKIPMEEGFDYLGPGFKARFLKWSGCSTVCCDSRGLVTNMNLSHLASDFPLGMSASQFEEELGRALFGVPSTAWKLEAIASVQECFEDSEFPELVSLWFEEDRRIMRSEAQAANEGALPRSEAQAQAANEGALPRSEAQAQAANEGALPRSGTGSGCQRRCIAQVRGTGSGCRRRCIAQVKGTGSGCQRRCIAQVRGTGSGCQRRCIAQVRGTGSGRRRRCIAQVKGTGSGCQRRCVAQVKGTGSGRQ